MRYLPEDEQQRLLAACYERSGLTPEQLWMRYFALGGGQSLLELDAYLNGLTTLPRVDRDMLAHAVNERLDELAGPPRAPYSHSFRDGKPLHGPLKALVDLLEGAHRAPPERLPAIAAEAGRALDLRIGIYLADYDQRTLVPLRAEAAAELDIETSVAGDVFRRAETVVTRDGPGPTLWTVLLDGVERLGVLEVVPTDDADLDDPMLREQCHWLATLLGHLVTVTTQYGDGLDVRRRRQHRASPAELLWQSLPPLTGARTYMTSRSTPSQPSWPSGSCSRTSRPEANTSAGPATSQLTAYDHGASRCGARIGSSSTSRRGRTDCSATTASRKSSGTGVIAVTLRL